MGTISRVFVLGCALALIAFCNQNLLAATPQPSPLAYRLLPDQGAVYAINIEADLPDSKATLSGNLFLTVKSVDSDTGQITLTTSANLSPHVQPKPTSGGPRVPMPAPFGNQQYNAQRQIVIDDKGKVIKNEGEAQLPFLLGNIWSIAFEPLPAERKNSWDVDAPIQFSSKHGRMWGLPLGYSETNMSGQEKSHYELGKSHSIDISISKKYELTTDEKATMAPRSNKKEKARSCSARPSALIKSVDMKIVTRLNQNNTSVRIPVTMSAKLLPAQEAEKLTSKRKSDMEAAHAAAMEKMKPKPMDEAEIQVALIELKDRDMFTVEKACKRLEVTPPVTAFRKEVTKALEPLLNDRNEFVRIDACKALGVWGNKDNVPALTAIASDGDYFVKEAAKAALVSIMNSSEGRHGGKLTAAAPKQLERSRLHRKFRRRNPTIQMLRSRSRWNRRNNFAVVLLRHEEAQDAIRRAAVGVAPILRASSAQRRMRMPLRFGLEPWIAPRNSFNPSSSETCGPEMYLSAAGLGSLKPGRMPFVRIRFLITRTKHPNRPRRSRRIAVQRHFLVRAK